MLNFFISKIKDYVKAYDLYFNWINSSVTDEFIEKVLKTKIKIIDIDFLRSRESESDVQETSYSMKINITDNWLLGLIEGKG